MEMIATLQTIKMILKTNKQLKAKITPNQFEYVAFYNVHLINISLITITS